MNVIEGAGDGYIAGSESEGACAAELYDMFFIHEAGRNYLIKRAKLYALDEEQGEIGPLVDSITRRMHEGDFTSIQLLADVRRIAKLANIQEFDVDIDGISGQASGTMSYY